VTSLIKAIRNQQRMTEERRFIGTGLTEDEQRVLCRMVDEGCKLKDIAQELHRNYGFIVDMRNIYINGN